jgi:NAD-dependent dihydropyrimidine dehydrogenase PreA subunit
MTTVATDKAYEDLWRTYASHPLGASKSKTFTEILKFYFEPEEAALAAKMSFQPESEEVIAKRAGVRLEEASELLTKMASKFFVIGFRRPDGRRTFRLKIIVIADGLFEIPFIIRDPSPDLERLGLLWDQYFDEGFGAEAHSGGVAISRTLPAIKAPKENVLPFEDAVELVKKASSPAILPCSCRSAHRNCDDPVRVCIALSTATPSPREDGTPVIDGHHLVGNPARIRRTDAEEVVETLKMASDAGLVHMTLNCQDDPWFICNCCRHACHLLRGVTTYKGVGAVAPSSFWTVLDEDLCNGCGNCEPRCPVNAITITDGLPEIEHELCLGCGQCTFVCAPDALSLQKREDKILTPPQDDQQFFLTYAQGKGQTYPVHTH